MFINGMSASPDLLAWRRAVMSRRAFLLGAAGGCLAALFPAVSAAGETPALSEQQQWLLLDRVQQHLFPSEPDAPGAKEIHALDYLRFVVADEGLDRDDRLFLLKGAGWLEDIARKREGRSFLLLNEAEREGVLRQVASSDAGENWLSTLLLYLMEALLSDPVYGGNPDGIGWRWLGHQPGYPRPPADKRYGVLG